MTKPVYYRADVDLNADGRMDHLVFAVSTNPAGQQTVSEIAVRSGAGASVVGHAQAAGPDGRVAGLSYNLGNRESYEVYLTPKGLELKHVAVCEPIDTSDAKYNYTNDVCDYPVAVKPLDVHSLTRVQGPCYFEAGVKAMTQAMTDIIMHP